MQQRKQAFTLVELLVVITILAIISVVAYQNFWSAVGRAVSSTKIKNIATIESALQQYKFANSNRRYPAVDEYDATTNKWWYNSAETATPSNTIEVEYDGVAIKSVTSAWGGGKVMNTDTTPRQIGAKGTISQKTLGKQYLSQDLYDREIGDLKQNDGNTPLIEQGIGRYVYAVYRKPLKAAWDSNSEWDFYNIAYTIKKEGSDTYVTKIVGDYDMESCFDKSKTCPKTLIGSWDQFLVDTQVQGMENDGTTAISNFTGDQDMQGIPYPVSDF